MLDPNPQQVESLIADQDTLALLRLLRTHPNPDVRSLVARKLPELDKVEIVEGLIRSYQLDTDMEVKRSAHNALIQILGETASQAIRAYGDIQADDNEYENALIEAQGQVSDESAEDEHDYAPQIQEALVDQDVQRLQNILASSSSSDLRAQSAEALGELKVGSSYEALIRSTLADPDEFVRKVARQTLNLLLDPNTATAAVAAYGDFNIQEYQANLISPMISNYQEGAEENGGDLIEETNLSVDKTALSIEQISALASVISDDRHPEKQIKALNIFADQPTMEGNNAISMAALWSENAIVRQHALKILKSVHGEELKSYLDEFQKSYEMDEEPDLNDQMDDEEDEDEEQDTLENSPFSDIDSPKNLPSTHQPEASFSGLQIILFILLMIILLLVARRLLLP